jgi:hypothetical protein
VDEVAPTEPLSESVLAVSADPKGVWAGRRLVESALGRHVDEALAVTGGMVARELLANAIEHGEPPITVRVLCYADHARIEVSDGCRSGPVPVRAGGGLQGSAGIDVVERLCRRWGNHRRHDGKTVWADLEFAGEAEAPHGAEVQALLSQWLQGEAHHAERYTVVLEEVPVALLLRSQARLAALVRPEHPGVDGVPPHLREALRDVVTGLHVVRDALVREAQAAAAAGEERATLTLHLPPGVAAAGEAFLELMDEIDRRADAAGSPAAIPAEERLLRRWCVESIARQLPELRPEGPTDPPVGFDEALVHELRRVDAARQQADRAGRLHRLAAALASARTPQEVASIVVVEGAEALHASGAALLVRRADRLTVLGAVHYPPALVEALCGQRLDAALPAAQAVRTGEPVWLRSPAERAREFPALRALEKSAALCAVPLHTDDVVTGALRFSFDHTRVFDDDERTFVLALAADAARAFRRTGLG